MDCNSCKYRHKSNKRTKNSQKIKAKKPSNHWQHSEARNTSSPNDSISWYSGCLQGVGSCVCTVCTQVRAPVTPAITNGSPCNPLSASPTPQSKGTVSTHVKSRREQEEHSGRKKERGKGLVIHLHMPVILIYTGFKPPRSEFTLVARTTGLFPPH